LPHVRHGVRPWVVLDRTKMPNPVRHSRSLHWRYDVRVEPNGLSHCALVRYGPRDREPCNDCVSQERGRGAVMMWWRE
jgi:hypothetical protein